MCPYFEFHSIARIRLKKNKKKKATSKIKNGKWPQRNRKNENFKKYFKTKNNVIKNEKLTRKM